MECITDSDFILAKDENDVYYDSLRCFVTKEAYNSGITELGLGLTVSRVARTGLISICTPALDFISLKSFVKHGIRKNSLNQRFSYWFPIY